ncbi:M23 family metallopeptidase [Sphingomonas sanguinis]|uniref:M23 family metallopeptidase n=1 Tax=Sphingomonas sanguinis TaxID=33051 RepID=A0ABU5LV73_9SPHN|nr:M23 family metallopeptidase [Sphingomonas sanguinis]MDZ7283827.1 M23 family metallopeptidase [Sphingomonas sanguinis]
MAITASSGNVQEPIPTRSTPWPIAVHARVLHTPTPFPSESTQHLFYELLLTNFSNSPIQLHQIDVLDGDRPARAPLASLSAATLASLTRTVGYDDAITLAPIPAGGTQVVFLEVKIPEGEALPEHLVHRLSIGSGTVTMAAIPVRRSLKVLGRPVTGSDWIAADAPSNDPDNHHRRGLFIINGVLTDSRRLAIDWKIMKDGKSYRGNAKAAASYFAYGHPLLAVADAKVVRVEDGHPDNPAGHGIDFHPAEPITIDNIGGNLIVLDLGDGQYAHYFHMKTGSIRVRVGDHVRKGQVIGAIGSSGDAREPHVHLEVTDAIGAMAGEGLPYVIDHYSVIDPKTGALSPRASQMPLDDMMVDFGK